ncbi:MAG: hypothetical protein AAF984_04790 [Verrucomicrobiota bacterium]
MDYRILFYAHDMDPFSFIKDAANETVIYGISAAPEKKDETRIDFLVRDRSKNLETILQAPRFEARAGMVIVNEILLCLMLFKLHEESPIYETFWDYYTHAVRGPQENIFCYLSEKQPIYFNLFGDSGDFEGLVETNHSLQDFFLEAIERAEQVQAWTRQEYNEARNTFTKDMPKQKLWEALQKSSSL